MHILIDQDIDIAVEFLCVIIVSAGQSVITSNSNLWGRLLASENCLSYILGLLIQKH